MKIKFTYNGWGIAFHGKVLWNSVNECARNFVVFGVNNILSSHTVNWKNNFLVLGEGPTQDINDSTDSAEKNLVLTLIKQIQSFA